MGGVRKTPAMFDESWEVGHLGTPSGRAYVPTFPFQDGYGEDGQLLEWTPEQRLQAATLIDAIGCYRKGKREAIAWFDCTDDPGAFSFQSICTSLRLEPTAVLRAIRSSAPRAWRSRKIKI